MAPSDFVRSRSRYRLFWADGCSDQPTKRVSQRNFRRCAPGLWSRGDRWRQEHVRQRNGADHSPIGRFTSLLGSHSDDDGALKLTIQKFYRVAGGSTQLHGVASDIVLPSLSDLPEYGEGALKNALAYDEVTKAKYTKWSDSILSSLIN